MIRSEVQDQKKDSWLAKCWLVYLAGVCVGLHVGLLLLLIVGYLEVEVGGGGGGEVERIGAGGCKLGELGLLRPLAGRWVAERVLKQHFLNRLPHLQQGNSLGMTFPDALINVLQLKTKN